MLAEPLARRLIKTQACDAEAAWSRTARDHADKLTYHDENAEPLRMRMARGLHEIGLAMQGQLLAAWVGAEPLTGEEPSRARSSDRTCRKAQRRITARASLHRSRASS